MGEIYLGHNKISRFIASFKEMVSQNGILILVLSVVLAPFILLLFTAKPPSESVKKLEELRRIAADTPLNPDFKEIHSSTIVKEHAAVLSFFYNVPAYATTFNKVKNYYTLILTPKGWRLDNEGTYGGNVVGVTFRKGEYTISLYNSEGRTEGWDYAISYDWGEP